MRVFENYEQVAVFLINQFAEHFGLAGVEGKQRIGGHHTHTNWEIEGKGVQSRGEDFVRIECRRYTTSKLKQEALAGLAYRIYDTGAAGGIVVTPLGLQEGAAKVAKTANIVSVKLDANSTTSDYVLQFLKAIMVGVSSTLNMEGRVEAAIKIVRRCERCGRLFEAGDNESVCSTCAKH